MEKHYNRRTVVIILSVLLIIGAFFLVKWVIHGIMYVSTDDAQVKGNLVGVSSKVAARIIYLGVEEGDMVKKDQIISRLDDRDIKASLDQASASAESARIDENRYAEELAIRAREASNKVSMASDTVSSSRDRLDISRQDLAMAEETDLADLKRQEASMAAAKASYAQTVAEYNQARNDAARADKLYKQGYISQQQQEQAKVKSVTAKEMARAGQENIIQQARLLEMTKSHLRDISIKKSQYKSAGLSA
ncbi:MAG: biotin/lipoyl-binding protein, partial [Firmicutes bacterium]|nr:biotin/lipoyl-binding protein [Bacillota bacterium]